MMLEPTIEQAEQCALVQQDIIEIINRLAQEGIDRRVITAGLAAATAATVQTYYGPAEVCTWFAKQAAMTAHLGKAQS